MANKIVGLEVKFGKLKQKFDFSRAVPPIVIDESTAQFKTDKKNKIMFRTINHDDEQKRKDAVKENVLRGCLFAVMAIILPFAFMPMKNTKKPFNVLKFDYSAEDDFLVLVNESFYRSCYATPNPEPEQPQVFDL